MPRRCCRHTRVTFLMQSGQSCACLPAACWFTESVYDTFLEKFVAVIEASAGRGPPLNPQVVCSALLVSQTAADRILSAVASDSAPLRHTGRSNCRRRNALAVSCRQGLLHRAHRLCRVDNSSALAQNTKRSDRSSR